MLQPFDSFRGFSRPRLHTPQTFARPEPGLRPIHFALGTVAGAGLAYFLDPDQGKRRRIIARDRSIATMRRFGRQLGRRGRKLTSDIQGQWQRVSHARYGDVEPQQGDLRPLETVPDFHGAEFRGTPQSEVFDFEEHRAA